MEDYTLTKQQKNVAFRILKGAGLQVADFRWETRELKRQRFGGNIKYSILLHRPEKHFFEFKFCLGTAKFSPGKDIKTQIEDSPSWGSQRLLFCKWTRNLKAEIDSPDLWADLEKYREALALQPSQDVPDNFIPAYEVEQITKKLSQLADRIEEKFNLDSQQNEFVRSKLTFLEAAAKKQSRQTWEALIISILIQVGFYLHSNPEQFRELVQFFKDAVGQFAYLIGS